MSQVSRRPIKEDLLERMFEIMEKSLVKLKDQKEVTVFLQDFLSPTEKIMLAKRLAMALLLSRGWDHQAICQYLKVSTSTITSIKNKLRSKSSGYHRVIHQIESDKDWEQMWLDLGQAFDEILSSRVDAHWKTEKAAVYKKYHAKRAKYSTL